MLACICVCACVRVCACVCKCKCKHVHEKYPQKLSGSIQAVTNALRLQIKNNWVEEDFFFFNTKQLLTLWWYKECGEPREAADDDELQRVPGSDVVRHLDSHPSPPPPPVSKTASQRSDQSGAITVRSSPRLGVVVVSHGDQPHIRSAELWPVLVCPVATVW